MPSRTPAFALLAPLAVAAAMSGCNNDPEFVTLFDENGAWSLTMYNTEGSLVANDSTNRRDKFLIYFDRTSAEGSRPAGRMAAATCIDAMGDQSLKSSACDAGFTCRCFDYTFEDATMIMAEYAPAGGQLYVPEEGDPNPGEPVTVFVSEVADSANTYNFKPLPFMLFESDQVDSEYHFRQKAASVFDETGCFDPCFGASEGEGE